jgi:UDP-GlcNAc:undecaprenyl-phosphate/decaprenyl-phosphate GlcNAc-1-phosphate transferase
LVVGFCVSLAFTPLVRILALRTGNIDLPIGNKIHKSATPLMGGVAIYLGFAIAALMVAPRTHALVGLVIGGAAAAAVGVVDEFVSLPPLVHLSGQVAAAVVAVVAGIGIVHAVSSPLAGLTAPGITLPWSIGFLLTVFWLVGMMNTVNFLDGLDGLATGVACLAALLLAIWASEPQRFFLPAAQHREDLLLPLAFAGALLGFLPYNWHRARIFIGDSGSMSVGLLIAALAIVGPAKLGTALLILIIPVLDVAWAVVRRVLRGRSFLTGDKQHVYHRMMELGMSHTATVLTLYGLCFALGFLDLVFVKEARLVAFIVFAILTIAGFVALEVRASKNMRSTTPVV